MIRYIKDMNPFCNSSHVVGPNRFSSLRLPAKLHSLSLFLSPSPSLPLSLSLSLSLSLCALSLCMCVCVCSHRFSPVLSYLCSRMPVASFNIPPPLHHHLLQILPLFPFLCSFPTLCFTQDYNPSRHLLLN